MGNLEAGEVSISKLKKALLPLSFLRLGFRDWALDVFLETHPFKLEDKVFIRNSVATHASVHKCLFAMKGQPAMDTTPLSKISPSSHALVQLICDLCFKMCLHTPK